jgi:glycosyltransferase involved in cell wall biosynthesis
LVRKNLKLDSAAAQVELISFGPQNRFKWNALTIPKFLRKRKDIEIFHTHYILPFFTPKQVKLVAHIHDVSFARYPQYIEKMDLFFLNLFIPRTVKKAIIVAPSAFTKREIIDVYQVAEENIVVVPNAPGEDFLQRLGNGDEGAEVREKYQLSEKYLLYVGTLQPRKNIPYLLEMFHEYKEHGTDAKLVLVGNRKAHHFDTDIDEAITRLGLEDDVIFPGYVENEDLPTVYKNASLFVFPSLYEGFAIPLLEALSAGVQTLASDIPVHREVGGDAVTYFPLGNVAEAAKILYTIPITEHVHPNTREYSWNTSACLLADLYHKMSH